MRVTKQKKIDRFLYEHADTYVDFYRFKNCSLCVKARVNKINHTKYTAVRSTLTLSRASFYGGYYGAKHEEPGVLPQREANKRGE